MDPRTPLPQIPLTLTSFVILSPTNTPLYVRSYTGKEDDLRHYHLSHAALDVIEERIVMTSTPTKPADSYLGLLFCMEDMAFYGFQTPTKLRMILSIALVDALIKDGDIVAIFRAVHHLLLTTINNPFISLPPTFRAKRVSIENTSPHINPPNPPEPVSQEGREGVEQSIRNPVSSLDDMFKTDPNDISPLCLQSSVRFETGMKRIGEYLSGGRA